MSFSRQPGDADPFERERRRMVAEQIRARGVRDERVLRAMATVPRHCFVDRSLAAEAYQDHPLPIGRGQTVSQPYIVAFMVEALGLREGARVLEVGTGTGYQAAVLAETGFGVFTIEVRSELALAAERILGELGYDESRVSVRCGDGSFGWLDEAQFDGILVAAAPRQVPPALFDQLAPGGTLVVPVGEGDQTLWRYRRTPAGFQGEELFAVRFVPMTSG